jgi:hypothetical protein
MNNRIPYLVSVMILMCIFDQNGTHKYHVLFEQMFSILKIMLVIEVAPIFYRAVDI